METFMAVAIVFAGAAAVCARAPIGTDAISAANTTAEARTLRFLFDILSPHGSGIRFRYYFTFPVHR
jgi:hypothetical protein